MNKPSSAVSRRTVLAALGASLLPGRALWAQDTGPRNRPLRLIVGYAAGGGDVLTRIVSGPLSQALQQPVVVENRPGAGGTLAAGLLASSVPDGHTLYMADSSILVAPAIYEKLQYDPATLTPVFGTGHLTYCVVVHPSFPANSVAELIQVLKASPGKYSYASPGVGNIGHLAGEMFKRAAGVEMLHVPYKGGGPAITDLVGGQVPICFISLPLPLSMVGAGKLRILGVTTARRSEAAPQIPTIAETLPGFDAATSMFVLAPPETPPEVVSRLADGFRVTYADPAVRQGFLAQGATVAPREPAQAAAQIKSEIVRWAEVVRAAGIQPGST